MHTVLLAGGMGTRLSEETHRIPKPMIKIGKYPIIFHIMKHYSDFSFNKFIVCGGYKYNYIKNFFLQNQKLIASKKFNWDVNIINTGLKTQTGARIRKIKKYLKNEKIFFMTYGDGVSNVNIKKILQFHKKHKKIATLTAVRPLPRFGNITLNKNKVSNFSEKDRLQEGWINGGFFILNKEVFDYIDNRENCIFEREPLQNLSKNGQLMAYKHEGFWHPMDTLRDKTYLNELIKKKKLNWLK
jgi:glucose-1-phosphate cytidylyltransferase